MFANRYRRKLAPTLDQTARDLVGLVDARTADERATALLATVVSIQSHTLLEFAVEQRREPDMRAFADRVLLPEPARLASRVAVWGLAATIPSSGLGHRYPDAAEAALQAFGVENAWEDRLAHFEPTAVPDMQAFQFNRYSVEGMVGAALDLDDPEPGLPAVMTWQARMIDAFVALREVMDGLHPRPGFSALSEAEARVKQQRAEVADPDET
jgi:hypothetical protein